MLGTFLIAKVLHPNKQRQQNFLVLRAKAREIQANSKIQIFNVKDK